MNKDMMLWKEIKTKFENEFLCTALRGRVRVDYTDYADDINAEESSTNEKAKSVDNCLSFYVDDRLIYKFDTKDYTEQFASINSHLRHTIQEVLSKSYMCWRDAFEASWEIANEFIPCLTSQKGIMRAEHAVRIMGELVNSSKPYDLLKNNNFSFTLWYMSKDLCGTTVLENRDIVKSAYAETWFYPFVELRIEAENRLLTCNETQGERL